MIKKRTGHRGYFRISIRYKLVGTDNDQAKPYI